MSLTDAPHVEHWRAVFRHSAGALGSHYLAALRDERRIVGWRTGSPPAVYVPPKDLGAAGEWVDVGPEATLLSFAPAAWCGPEAAEFTGECLLGRIALDGADTPMFALVHRGMARRDLHAGMRVKACFEKAGKAISADFWFEPVAEE